MATYLVTGAAGFIAARTSALLLEAGHTVVGFDNLNDYYDIRLKEHRLAALATQPRFHFVRGDIEQPPDLAALFSAHRFDAVLNLAARAGVRPSIAQPRQYFATNVDGTLNVLEAMRLHGVKKFVLASSSSLYAGQPMPFHEDLAVNTPLSPYAASKKAAEMLAYTYHHLHGIDCSVLRFFTVYGPASRPDMGLLRFTAQIDRGLTIELLGDGSQSRDFTHVDDIARGTIASLRPLGYEIINLGGGRNSLTIASLIAQLEALLGQKAVIERKPFHPADLKETWADIGKAARLLHWQPTVPLADGLRESIAWYRTNATWLSHLQL